MRPQRAACVWRTAGLILPLALALCAPALAADSVTTPDGRTIRVWPAVALPGPGDAGGRYLLAYSVSGASGTSIGTLDASGGAIGGEGATLALDSASGSPVAVWSRHDGAVFRIAYARFDNGSWTDIHDLTFGTDDATQPRIGSGRSGAWLFWVAGGDRFLYAPIDLSNGHLFAAPRELIGDRTLTARTGKPAPRNPHVPQVGAATVGDGNTCGGQDCPVVLPSGHGRGGRATRWGQPPSLGPKPAPNAAVEGNIDAPVILGLNVWNVVSSPDCRSLIVVVPEDSDITLLRFHDGHVSRVGRSRIPLLPASDDLATTLATSSLELVCD